MFATVATLRGQTKSRVDLFFERFEYTTDKLGKGSFGEVYCCLDRQNNMQEVAVKTMLAKTKDEENDLRTELKIGELCTGHPNIVSLLDWGTEYSMDRSVMNAFLAFEKSNGGSLEDELTRLKYIEEKQLIHIASDLGTALEFLHSRGISHCDIKPGNVLCHSQAELCPVKLCDFGLSTVDNTYKTRTRGMSSVCVSYYYMAPEVIRSSTMPGHTYDNMGDLWSLGVLLYEAFTGAYPFSALCSNSNCACEEKDSCVDELILQIFDGLGQTHSNHLQEFDISWALKSLLGGLLQTEPGQRLTAQDVLNHTFTLISTIEQ